jgi:hypothetical protein
MTGWLAGWLAFSFLEGKHQNSKFDGLVLEKACLFAPAGLKISGPQSNVLGSIVMAWAGGNARK